MDGPDRGAGDRLIRGLRHGRAAEGQVAATRARRWRSRPLGHVLFSRIMRHDPHRPAWPDRDRFVLSNGHASILQYSMLFLSGFGLELDDLEAFRQWESRTPGHPEAHHTPGIEVTTGPLGQGFANAVGMAIAERVLRARFGADLDRPPHVRHRRRRLLHGGRQPRGRLARRPPRPRQAGLRLRRQPHHDRRRHRAVLDRRRRRALRGLRLARRATSARSPTTSTRSRRPSARRHGGRGPARPPRAAQPHRLPLARLHRRPAGPRQPVHRRGRHPHQGRHGHPATSRSGRPPTSSTPTASAAPAGRRPARHWQERFDALRRRRPGRVGRVPGTAPARRAGRTTLPTFEPGEKIATRQAIAEGDRRRCSTSSRPRLGRRRPHRQHRHQARRRRRPVGRAPRRPPDPLRHPRARHGRGHDRHGPARRRPAGRRHVLRVQRLHAPAGAPGRPVSGPRSSSCSPTTRSASARTAPPTSRSSTSPRCGPSRAAGHPPGRRQRDRRRLARAAVDHDGPDRAGAQPPGLPVADRRLAPSSAAPASSSHDADARRSSSSAPAARCRCASTPPRRLAARASRVRVVSHAVWDRFERAARRLPATRAAARRAACCRSRRPPPSGGTRWADDSVGIDRFGASARRAPWCSTSSASTSTTWSPARATRRPSIDPPRRSVPMDTPDPPVRGVRPEPVARQPQARLPHLAASWPPCVDGGIRGLTSNPTIFQKAIDGSADYDEQFRRSPTTARRSIDDYWALVPRTSTARSTSSPAVRRRRRRRRLRQRRGGARPGP